MFHYTVSVASSLTPDVVWQTVLQKRIPEIGMLHPFLMQGLLAISAFHLVIERPKERAEWMALGLKHGMSSSAQFRTLLPTVNESNCHALFALSIMTCIQAVAFGSFGIQLSPGEILPISDVMDLFNIIRGTGELQMTARDWLMVGPLSPILSHDGFRCYLDALPTKLPPDSYIKVRFRKLHDMVRTRCPSISDCESLAGALHTLEIIYDNVAKTTQDDLVANPGIVFMWPAMVPPGFKDLLREFHGGALVVYAHFACIADVLKGHGLWFCDAWGDRTVRAIAGGIDDEWREWVEWPEAQLGKGHAYLQAHTHQQQSPTHSNEDSATMDPVASSLLATELGFLRADEHTLGGSFVKVFDEGVDVT